MSKLSKTALVSLLISLTASAEITHPASFDEVFHAALEKSEVVQDQGELVNQSEENYNQAIGGVLPSVSGTAFYFQQQPTANSSISTEKQKQVKISGDQPLFRGFREYAGIKQTKLLTAAQKQLQKQSVVQLYQQVAVNVYQVLAAERDIRNIQTESGLYEKRIGELNSRVRIGRSRPAEVTQIQSSLESLQATLEASKDQLSTARKNFSFLTGLSDTTPIVDPFPEEFQPKLDSLENYVGAIERRPEVQNYIMRRDAADEGIWVAKGAHLPSIDLTGDYYAYRSGGIPGGRWDFQLTLTLPIYAGGTIQSKVRQAASQYRESELSLSRGQRLADQEIRTYYARVQLDNDQVATLQKSNEYAKKNYEQQTRDYRLGLVTNLDVLQSLTAYQEAERSLDRAKFQAKTDYLYLLSATGKASDTAVAF